MSVSPIMVLPTARAIGQQESIAPWFQSASTRRALHLAPGLAVAWQPSWRAPPARVLMCVDDVQTLARCCPLVLTSGNPVFNSPHRCRRAPAVMHRYCSGLQGAASDWPWMLDQWPISASSLRTCSQSAICYRPDVSSTACRNMVLCVCSSGAGLPSTRGCVRPKRRPQTAVRPHPPPPPREVPVSGLAWPRPELAWIELRQRPQTSVLSPSR